MIDQEHMDYIEKRLNEIAVKSFEKELFKEHELKIVKFLATRCPGTIDMFGGLPGWVCGYLDLVPTYVMSYNIRRSSEGKADEPPTIESVLQNIDTA